MNTSSGGVMAEHGITRRSFLAAGAAVAATVGISGAGGVEARAAEEKASTQIPAADPFADCEVYYACCSPECQHHSLKGYVRDGKLVKVEAGEVNECGICPRGISRVEMLASDERLTVPLKRTGAKGSGQFEEISWDEAFDLIEQHIRDTVKTDGSKSIAFCTDSGNFSNLARTLWPPFFSWIGDGCTELADNTCCGGIDAGLMPILGERNQQTRDQFANSDYVIFWGTNSAVTLGGYFERFEEVTAKGGTLCTVDPFYTETAAKSSEWLQIYPSSDVALGLHMLNTIVTEKLYDEDYLLAHTTAPCVVAKGGKKLMRGDAKKKTSYLVYDKRTKKLVAHDAKGIDPALSLEGTRYAGKYKTVFDRIVEKCAEVDDATLERECGVSAEDAKRVARGYAKAEHAMIIQNMGGFQRTEFGAWATALGVYLALFTGNIGHEGDGVYDVGGAKNIIWPGDAYETNPKATEAGVLHRVQFGEQVLKDDPYKIDMLLISMQNFVSQLPNSNMVKKGLEKIPFVVTLDMFMTSTCEWSDLVLPIAAVFEKTDITANNRSNIISLSEKAVSPPGEAKTDLEVAAELAKRLGFGEKFGGTPEHYIDKVLKPYGLDYEQMTELKAVDARKFDPGRIAYEGGVFPTESKKAEMFVEAWEDEGFPPVPEWRRTGESILNAGQYPLAAVQRKGYRSVHTTFSHSESLAKMFGEFPSVFVNPADAEARGIDDGDTVTVFNDRGEHRCTARVTWRAKEHVVVLENGWEDRGDGATSSSNVTANAFPTLGSLHTCNSTLVDVRKGE